MITKLTVPTTRSDGKRVDTWTFDMPDGNRSTVTVNMITGQQGISFNAACTDGLLKGLSIASPEINHLKDLVVEAANAIASDYLAADWHEALVIKAKSSELRPHQRSSFGMELHWSSAFADRATPPTNEGEVRILQEGLVRSVRQRGHTDNLQDDPKESLATRANRIRSRDTSVSVMDATPEVVDGLKDLRDTYRLFVDKFLARMSPDALDREGIPSPEDLVFIMTEAEKAWKSGERVDEIRSDEILI